MKAIKLLILSFIFAGFSSCEEDDAISHKTGLPVDIHFQKIEIHAKSTCEPLAFEDNCAFTFSDKCECNLSSESSFQISGIFHDDLIKKHLNIEMGKLIVFGNNLNNTKSYMCGELTGATYLDGSKFRLLGVVQISEGAGCMEACQGELSLLVEGDSEMNSGDGFNYELTLIGYIAKNNE